MTVAASFIPRKYIREFHVDAVNGNDAFSGSEQQPFKTIAHALTQIDEDGGALYLHTGLYTDAVDFNKSDVDIIGVSAGGQTVLSGSWTFSHQSGSVRGENLAFSAIGHTNNGDLALKNCAVGSFTTAGNQGSYTAHNVNHRYGAASINLIGSGMVSFIGGQIGAITIGNPNASVTIQSVLAVGPINLQAGKLAVQDSTLTAPDAASNSLSTAAGSYLILRDGASYINGTTNPAKVALAGSYAMTSWIYDQAASTITGANLGNEANFDALNAKFVRGLDWEQARAYPAGALVVHTNKIYRANGTIASGTAFAEGTEGATWRALSGASEASGGSSGGKSLTYAIPASDITVSGSGASVTVAWPAQANAVRYRVFSKLESAGDINIVSDTPVATITNGQVFANVSVTAGVNYQYAVLADLTVAEPAEVDIFATIASFDNLTIDTIDLNTGTTASFSWTARVGASTYKIFYAANPDFSSPSEITTTQTSYNLTGLTTNTVYSFKVEAYNASGAKIAESAIIKSPVIDRIKIKMFYSSTANIAVSAASRSGDIATITTSSAHGLKIGNVVTITGDAPFAVTYAHVLGTPSTTTFEYRVANSGASTASNVTVTHLVGAYRSWNIWEWQSHLASLQSGTKTILPRYVQGYYAPSNYSSDLLYPSAKYQFSGETGAGKYLILPIISGSARYAMMDTDGNSSAFIYGGQGISLDSRQDKFLFNADDHDSYMLWIDGTFKLQTNGTNNFNGSIWYTLNGDLTENNSAAELSPFPSGFTRQQYSIPCMFHVSGFMVIFDLVGNQVICYSKNLSKVFSSTFSTLGITATGFASSTSPTSFAVVSDGVNSCIFGRSDNAYRLTFDFERNTIAVNGNVFTPTWELFANGTEEDAFGHQLHNVLDLYEGKCLVPAVLNAGSGAMDFAFVTARATGVQKTISGISIPGNGSSQTGSDIFGPIDGDGRVWFADWGHDGPGLFRPTPAEDNGLGIMRSNIYYIPENMPFLR